MDNASVPTGSREPSSETAVKAKYWILTIPHREWVVPNQLASDWSFIRGQRELGAGGFDHWQILVAYHRQVRRRTVRNQFGRTVHAEPTRSSAAREYVWKEDTRVDGSQFELGSWSIRRNNGDNKFISF